MSRSEEIRRDQHLAEEARPLILERLRSGGVPLEIAREVAGRFAVDEAKAYRWVAYIAEDFERRRKRIGVIGLLLLWPGVIALAGGPLLSLVGVGEIRFWLVGIIVGLPLAIPGSLMAFRARRLVRDTM